MNIENLLPIGSVVLLKGGVKRLMIYGVRQTDKKSQVEYDYIGVLYPEGNIGDDYQYLFNHDDIQEIYFKGFEDDERARFIERLKNYYDRADHQ
ncbi:MAG TPA: DUF4176 domain-containing protein [Candidatus Scybalocola faecavium]|nr:DUF4176 domain-containing protein [Candidatus Scybalocola faecavium]